MSRNRRKRKKCLEREIKKCLGTGENEKCEEKGENKKCLKISKIQHISSELSAEGAKQGIRSLPLEPYPPDDPPRPSFFLMLKIVMKLEKQVL